jgi:hypothetical protein
MTQKTIDFTATATATRTATTNNPQFSKKTMNAIAKYGIATCVRACQLNEDDGEGPNTIAQYLGLKTSAGHYATAAANACINAGREILAGE